VPVPGGGAPVITHGDGACQGLMGGGSPRGRGPVIPHVAGAQQGLKGGELRGGEGIPASCGTGSRLGSGVDRWRGSCHVWVWCRAVAQCSLSGGKPSRTEQQLCRPTGQGFGRPAVLLLDYGVEKSSSI
jgi:hypothetical protein